MKASIDLAINCYERTYRKVLSPGFFKAIERQNKQVFRKVAIINNVNDRSDAESRAHDLLKAKEIDTYYFVADHIASALKTVGLNVQDLKPIPHFIDWALVIATIPGSEWILHWDAEIKLEHQEDWITPARELMEKEPGIFTANPNWKQQTLEQETRYTLGDFAIGYGFSDQLFLTRRKDLNAPIYNYFCPISLRYPLAHLGSTFEKRIDAYMRNKGRTRATYKKLRYLHPENEGVMHPPANAIEKAKIRSIKIALKLLSTIPIYHPMLKE